MELLGIGSAASFGYDRYEEMWEGEKPRTTLDDLTRPAEETLVSEPATVPRSLSLMSIAAVEQESEDWCGPEGAINGGRVAAGVGAGVGAGAGVVV